jgi:uncharacterized membrane protein (DUF106 family)
VCFLHSYQEEIDRLEEEIEEAEEAGDEAKADKLRATRREELLKKMKWVRGCSNGCNLPG